MKRLSPSHELILDDPALLVGQQRTVFEGDLLAQGLEARFHQIHGSFGVRIMNRQLKQLATEKAALHRRRLGLWQKAFPRLDFQHPNCRLISRKRNCKIQRMLRCPRNQLFRSIAPAQPEWRLENRLAHSRSRQQEDRQDQKPFGQKPRHAASFRGNRALGKPRSLRRGFVLLEAAMALSLLTVLGLILLKLSLNVLHPRQWTLQQVVTDAYLTYERAYAERIPFEDLLAEESPWPAFPETSSTVTEIGRLPGGVPITGTVVRTRIADTNNYPLDGGVGTLESNPAAMKVWKAQSVLTYRVGNKTYAKSRTVLRSQ
jgi:hypothetical protein